jgi:hypothetical protein
MTMALSVKGRTTIRRYNTSSLPTSNPLRSRALRPRTINPWVLDAKPGSTLAKVEKSYLDALAAVDALEDRQAKAAASNRFTPAGLAADALQFAASDLAPKLRRAQQVLAAAKVEATSLRAKLTLKPADKTDAAGQMRRLWKLDKLNQMPAEERSKLMADVTAIDSELAAAILEMPGYASIHASDLKRLSDHVLEAQHGAEVIGELRSLEEGIAIAEPVLPMAREEIAQEVGGIAQFDAAAAPFEKAAVAPWLRKTRFYPPGGSADGEEVISVWDENEKSRIRRATPEEIERGVYYADIAEYRRARGETPTTEKTNGAAA